MNGRNGTIALGVVLVLLLGSPQAMPSRTNP